MKKLYVLYDSRCGLCLRCARWLTEEPAFLPLIAIPSGSHRAGQLFPGLRTSLAPEELVVIADTGEVYRDLSAWLMCLYALKRYRSWAFRLSRPGWSALARKAVAFLTDHRGTVSDYFGFRADFDDMAAAVGPVCSTGACQSPPGPFYTRTRQVHAAPSHP